MLPQTLSKQRFEELITFLMGQYRVVGPVCKSAQATAGCGHALDVIEDASQLDMDYPTTILPPKKYFMPQHESLLSFTSGEKAEVRHDVCVQATAIVGVHPYDIYATWLLDDAMARDPKDANYMARRERALVIGLDIAKPADEHMFCQDMGTLEVDEGYDLMLTDLGDQYYVDVATERGEALINDCGCFNPATQASHEAKAEFTQAKRAAFGKKSPYDTKYLPEILEESYDSLIWDALSRRCFSCGTCNLVCPTCYCFDVCEAVEMNLTEGTRDRKWDSCMLKNFAEVAGGENFREDKSARLRHRVFRKGKYLREMFGKSGCVGCGRCDRHCTADISILQIYKQLATQVGAAS